MTKAEKTYRNQVASFGCIICLEVYGVHSAASLHHVRRLATSKKRDRAPILPLCYQHHQGPHGIGIHSGRETWEGNFGSEIGWLDRLEELL